MPGLMFQDVVSPRARSNRKWYTVPLSFVVHTSVLAILIVVPLVATDMLPRPRTMLQFVEPYVPVVPQPPPVRRAPVAPVQPGTTGAPLAAPDVIGVETGLAFEPGAVETMGLDGIVGGLGAAEAVLDAPPAPPVVPTAPIPVGGLIKPPARTKYVVPEYPDIARAARVQGLVIIEAVIGIDGKVEQARVLRSNPLLEQAALVAVNRWEYTPTLLNGRPTPVIMTVTVHFTLK
jgi:protein TonB